jgi:hypothetical protein
LNNLVEKRKHYSRRHTVRQTANKRTVNLNLSIRWKLQRSGRRESNPHDQLGRLRLPRLGTGVMQVNEFADSP